MTETLTTAAVRNRPFSARRLFIGRARLERLHSAIVELDKSFELRSQRQTHPGALVPLTHARELLTEAASALAEHHLNEGWALLQEAERVAVEAETPEGVENRAEILRAEIQEKLSGWRQAAALRVLGERSHATVDGVRKALKIRDEHAQNGYHRLELIADQIVIVGILLFVGLAAALIASWRNVQPLHDYTALMVWAALIGGIGALLSTARTLTSGGRRRIPEQIADLPVTIVRPVIGATIGMVAAVLLQAGVVTIAATNTSLAPLAIAFIAGFSERYFLSLLSAVDK